MLIFTENNRRNTGLAVTTNPRTVLSSVGLGEATQAEAEAGAITGKFMSPLRVAQALDGGQLSASLTDLSLSDLNISISPTANETGGTLLPTYSALVVQATTSNANNREFAGHFGLTSNLGAGVPNNNEDKVALYAGITGNAGTGDIWSFNTVATLMPGSGDYSCQGYELDFNNYSKDIGSAEGIPGLAAPFAFGLTITGGSTFKSTAALVVACAIPLFDQWYRGVVVANGVEQEAYADYSNATYSYCDRGSHSYGIDLYLGTYSQSAIRLNTGHTIKWRNSLLTTDLLIFQVDNLDVLNIAQDPNVTSIQVHRPFLPGVDNGVTLGSTALKWADLFLGSGGVVNWDNGALTLTEASGSLTAASTAAAANFTFQTSEAGVTGPIITLNHASATPAASDVVGQIYFNGRDSGGNAASYGQISCVISDTTDTSEDGTLNLAIAVAGALTAKATLSGTQLSPAASDGTALGSTTLMWSDLFLASGGVINFNNDDVTITHAANTLTFAGASSGYSFDATTTLQGASSGILALRSTAANPTGTFIGTINYRGNDSIGTNTVFCQMNAAVVDYTDGSEDANYQFATQVAGTLGVRMIIAGGVYHASATGTDKGNNTINFGAVYDDNVLLTDYVFDRWLGNQSEPYSERVQAASDALDPRMFKQKNYADYFIEHRRFFGMPDLNDCIDGIVKEHSLGGMIQKLWQHAELDAIHMVELAARVDAIERRLEEGRA
jgi:hypothetical protein